MTPTLRPMSLGEILDRSLQIYRRQFWAFVAVAAIPALAMDLIYIADNTWLHVHSLVRPFRQPGALLWNFAVGLGFYHVSSFFGLLMQPAYTKLTANHVSAEECSVLSSLRFAAARWRIYLSVAIGKLSAELIVPEILTLLVMYIAGVLADLAGGLDGNALPPALLIVSLPSLAGFALFLWVGACLSLAVPVASLEGLGGFRALRRSWALTKGSRGRVWGTWLAVFATSLMAAWGARELLLLFVRLLGTELHGAAATRHLYLATLWVMNSVISILTGPIYPIALTLFYYDQRIRHEGYDIERMMDAAGLNATATLPAANEPVKPVADEPMLPETVTPASAEEGLA